MELVRPAPASVAAPRTRHGGTGTAVDATTTTYRRRERMRGSSSDLTAPGGAPSSIKDAAMGLGALNWTSFFEEEPDKSGKLVAFAYAFEHLIVDRARAQAPTHKVDAAAPQDPQQARTRSGPAPLLQQRGPHGLPLRTRQSRQPALTVTPPSSTDVKPPDQLPPARNGSGSHTQEVLAMAQQGQVLPLVAQGRNSTRWAYRYRVGGRGSQRVQRGGFESEHAAQGLRIYAACCSARMRGCPLTY